MSEIKYLDCGVNIGDTELSILLYADDIAQSTPDEKSLQNKGLLFWKKLATSETLYKLIKTFLNYICRAISHECYAVSYC